MDLAKLEESLGGLPVERKIRFQGREMIFIGSLAEDEMLEDGAIATEDQYLNFKESHAHLFDDGLVRRHGAVIGAREDIEDLGPWDYCGDSGDDN